MSWNKDDIFALMCGHGKSLDGSWDSGCTYGNYTEAELMLAITKVAVKYLRKSGVKVLTDADKNNNRNMTSCVQWSNKKNAKYYISVHCDYSKAPSGVAPLYTSSAGKKMAEHIGKSVAKQIGMKYRGVFKRTDLYELNATDCPAVIFETGSIKRDLKYLKESKKYGKALAKAICGYIGVPYVEDVMYTGKLPSKAISYGKTGEDVKRWQKFLNWALDAGLTVDGDFGEKTKNATKKFQKKIGLKATGAVNSATLSGAKGYKK